MGIVGVRGSFKPGERAPLPWDAQIARTVAKEYVSLIGTPFRVQVEETKNVIDGGAVDTERQLRRFFYELLGPDREPEKKVQDLLREIRDRVRCPLCKVALGAARGEAPQVVHRDDGIWVCSDCSDCFDCSTDGGYTTTRRQAAGASAFGGGGGGSVEAVDPRLATPTNVGGGSGGAAGFHSGAEDHRPQAPPDADALKPFERRCIAIAELVLFCEASNEVAPRYRSRELFRPAIMFAPGVDGTVRAVAAGGSTAWIVEMKAEVPYGEETVDKLLMGLLLALCWSADVRRVGLMSGAKGLALPSGVKAVQLGHFDLPPSEEDAEIEKGQEARREAALQDTRECRTSHGARAFLLRQGFPPERITEEVIELLRHSILREGASATGAKDRLERMTEIQFKGKLAEIRGANQQETKGPSQAQEAMGGFFKAVAEASPLKVTVVNPPAKGGGRIHLNATVEVDGFDIVKLILGGSIRLKDSIDTERDPGKVSVRSSSAVVVGPPWLDELLGEPSKDDQAAASESSVVIGSELAPSKEGA